MFKWLHHILEPHCPECKEEKQDEAVCKSCETLRVQLEIANHEKAQMMAALIRPQSSGPVAEPIQPEAVKPKTIPWVVRKQMLEAEDRKTAQLMREEQLAKDLLRGSSGGLKVDIPDVKVNQTIEDLEKELGVEQ